MYAKQEAIKEVLTALKKSLGKTFTVNIGMLVTPPNSKLGDLSFGCFELAKGQKRNPAEIATELAAKIEPGKLIAKATAVGPYVNFFFAETAYVDKMLKDVKRLKAHYGDSTLGKGKKVLVEYAQPNTHKEFHVGHIRNAVLGQSIVNLMKANGYETIAASYIGDIGAHVAKALWGLKKFHDGETFAPDERAQKLGEIYTEATTYVEDHPNAKKEIDAVQRALEAHEDPWWSQWHETKEWSLSAFKKIFAELGVTPDVTYFESQVEEEGKKIVQKLLTEGIAKKSEGAVIVDLESEGLGVALILKSDGSALYATKDIPLALLKEDQYHPDRQIFVVDVRQSLYFKQLFAILRRLGLTKQMTHLSYDMVTLPDGAMSSRKGNIITYVGLQQEMMSTLTAETKKRHADWSDKKVDDAARTIARAAITFMMLRQDPQSIITFDMDEAMSFDGFTGPYILYTVARIESIKSKTKIKPKVDAKLLTQPKEIALLKAVAEFPAVVERAGANFQVSSIAQWAFDTAKLFSEFYHEVHVIVDEDKALTAARLVLIDAVEVALKNALKILVIEAADEM